MKEPTRPRLSGKRRALVIALLCPLALALRPAPAASARGDEPPPEPKAPTGERFRGQLQFKSRKADFDGIDVGQVPNAPKHVAGDPDSPQRAVWGFDDLPRRALTVPGDVVSAKLTCSIFRLKAGGAGAVEVTVRAVSHTCPQAPPDAQQRGEWQWADNKVDVQGKTAKDRYRNDVAAYRAKKIDVEDAKPGTDDWKAVNELAEKYGYYEVRLPKVLDGVETGIDLPAGLFRNALKNDPGTDAHGKPERPRVAIYVKCETAGVLIGVAEPDLYLVEKAPAKR